MPGFDDRLTKELERSARPVDPAGVFERVERRRARRAVIRKLQVAALAVVVIAGTTTGVLVLNHAFRSPGERPARTGPKSVEPSPREAGRDLGLGFRICDVTRLGGIDFFGDGSVGSAWTGTRVASDGTCPARSDTLPRYLVAADFDGDGSADGWSETIIQCFACRPFAATDFNGDGIEELVVLFQGSSTPQYGIYGAAPPGSPRGPGLYPIVVASPGAKDAGFPGGEPITFSSGGDEGYEAAIDCEGYPSDPVLVVSWSDHPVEGPGSDVTDIYVTRLRLEGDTFQVVSSDHFTQPTTARFVFDARGSACGVDFDPWL